MVTTVSTSTLNRFPNLSSVGHWNSSIREAVNQGHSYSALLLFRQMKQTVRIGIDADVSVANTWVSAYAKCGDLSSAEKVFGGIDSNLLSVVSWNSIIAGCAYFERSIKAITFYQRMLYLEIRPDVSTILNLLSSFVQPEALCQGKLIHCHGIKVGCHSDISVLNTLISMYSKSGDVHSARHVFDGMMEKSCVSWTAMIGGYAEKGDLDEALALFHSMQAAGEKPDFVTVLCHAEDLLIYEALDGLALQMKEELDLLCVEELFYH
ncbi:hypothetical protein RJ639_010276 [Escallonia herrerae]|uniref:Pentatricopeptide repeat-containing protein n=1 Tax=Escallonia herrerae TaxID=1293975 RepID=A0AA88VTU1_9ASTE|nr:hypothetical protein RJ639_010276 [Escallonia herrerae]